MWLKINLIIVGITIAAVCGVPAYAYAQEELSASFLAQLSESLRGLQLRLNELLEARLVAPLDHELSVDSNRVTKSTIKDEIVKSVSGEASFSENSMNENTENGELFSVGSCTANNGGEGAYICSGVPSGAGIVRMTYFNKKGVQTVEDCQQTSCLSSSLSDSTTTF